MGRLIYSGAPLINTVTADNKEQVDNLFISRNIHGEKIGNKLNYHKV